jgi:protein phosphatase
MVRFPDLFGRFREQPNLVSVEDLREQLDAGRFLLDGNPPNHRIDAGRLGVACKKGGLGVNNDFVLVQRGLSVAGRSCVLFGVFDGVTGFEVDSQVVAYGRSHVVSIVAAEGIVGALGSSGMKNPAGAVAEALDAVNTELCSSLLDSGKGYTTATIVLLDSKRGSGVVGQVGDSRAYLLGRGGLDRLTHDQVTYEIVDGRKVRRLKPVLGSRGMVYDIQELELSKGGLLLLTTDGVHNALEPEAMQATVLDERLKGNLCFAANDLVFKAQHMARFAGGRVDDASAVIARI